MRTAYPPPFSQVNSRIFLRRLLLLVLLLGTGVVKAQLPMQCGVVLGPGSNQANPSVAPPQNPGPSTTCFEVQNIRVNVHFLQHDDGTGNFTATDDGRPVNPSTTTRKARYGPATPTVAACPLVTSA